MKKVYQIVCQRMFEDSVILDESSDLKHLKILLAEYKMCDKYNSYKIISL